MIKKTINGQVQIKTNTIPMKIRKGIKELLGELPEYISESDYNAYIKENNLKGTPSRRELGKDRKGMTPEKRWKEIRKWKIEQEKKKIRKEMEEAE